MLNETNDDDLPNLNNEEEPIRKRRGRKPKPKPVGDIVQKKKRGRKKKCEIDIETSKKITGFLKNDEEPNNNTTITFHDHQLVHDEPNETTDNISFGTIQIQRKKCKNTRPPIHILKQQYLTPLGPLVLDPSGPFPSVPSVPSVPSGPSSKNVKNDCLIRLEEVNITAYKQSYSNGGAGDGIEHEINEIQKSLCSFVEMSSSTTSVTEGGTGTGTKMEYYPNRPLIPKTQRKIQILHTYQNKTKVYPDRTDILCWWCCHSFDTPPRFLPTKFDTLRNRYRIMGNFCSWNCAKAHLLHDRGNTIKSNVHLFASMLHKITGMIDKIKTAPPRQTLKQFGGILTIDEFRHNFDKYSEIYMLQKNNFELDDTYKIVHKNLIHKVF